MPEGQLGGVRIGLDAGDDFGGEGAEVARGREFVVFEGEQGQERVLVLAVLVMGKGVHGLLEVSGQVGLELLSGVMQSGSDGSVAAVHDLCDFLMRQALHIMQDNHCSMDI